MSNKQILNASTDAATDQSKPAEQLSMTLQRHMLVMKGDFLAEDGRGVDYSSLRDSTAFKNYTSTASELRHVDLTTCTEQQRKAFFINIYNALTIHGLTLSSSLPSSVLEVEGFWRNTCYDIGGHVYSLDDIEHGILRANSPHPSSPEPLLKDGDPRLQFVMSVLDPRIHFALVCGAKSCPAIQVYSSEKLDRHLDIAARNFCSQEVSVNSGDNTVTVSKIFEWYGRDFGSNNTQLLQWLCPFLDKDQSEALQQLLNGSTQVSLLYKPYNWLLNKL